MDSPFRTAAPRAGDRPGEPDDEPARAGATALGSAVMPRNFTVTTDERVRGIVAGLPAFVRRRKRIEDLQAQARATLARLDAGDATDPDTLRARLVAQVEMLERLVSAHNRYYPIEANLPCDVRTGQYIEVGEPWRPLPVVTIESLRRSK